MPDEHSTDDEIPYGYCHCGCGEKTKIAAYNDPRFGEVKGQPRRYLKAHHHRRKIVSAQTRARISAAVGSGAQRPNWKGDNASYRAIHSYLSRHFPKTGICEECGAMKRTSYALIHGREYSRDRDDYREMCHKCHMGYDMAGIPLASRDGQVAKHRAKTAK